MANPRCITGVFVLFCTLLVAGCAQTKLTTDPKQGTNEPSWANHRDRQRADTLAKRAADWRCGAVVYQVLVDRFAPPADLDAKRHLYPPPKRLRAWTETPKRGEYLPEARVHSHEIDFWGGDIASLRARLDYIEQLGADVLYLNPIHQAYTNHKYDAQDYFKVSPEYGTRADVKALAENCHQRGLRLVLDGVFNHVGRTSPWFIEAQQNPESPWREWFYFGEQYEHGYRAWWNVANLPEVRLESPKVQARIFGDPDSVVQGYLRDGVDGWRLDVAGEIGFQILGKLTAAAHRARPGSLVVGEIWQYPEEWTPAVDAVMNLYATDVIGGLCEGRLSGVHAGRLFDRMIADAGIEPILRSWIILDNHDLRRLKTWLPETWQQRMAQVLQFTVPGSPCVYYGVELGMEGGDDPEQRGPMRWDLVNDENTDLQWMRKLIAIRRANRALRIGDFRLLDSESLLAFMRRTDRVAETTIVVANPTDKPISDWLPLRESKISARTMFRDELSGAEVQCSTGTLPLTVPPHTAWILRPVIGDADGYSPHKRVQ